MVGERPENGRKRLVGGMRERYRKNSREGCRDMVDNFRSYGRKYL